jgi:hypothetical protein
MKIMKLGERRTYTRDVRTPSLSDSIFSTISDWRAEFKLILDLYDETWVMERRLWSGRNLVSTDTTAIIRAERYSD